MNTSSDRSFFQSPARAPEQNLPSGIRVGAIRIEVNRIELTHRHAPDPVHGDYEPVLFLKIDLCSANRDTGAPIKLSLENRISTHEFLTIEEQVRNVLIGALTHEVCENIYKNGVRVFDPHAGEKT